MEEIRKNATYFQIITRDYKVGTVQTYFESIFLSNNGIVTVSLVDRKDDSQCYSSQLWLVLNDFILC